MADRSIVFNAEYSRRQPQEGAHCAQSKAYNSQHLDVDFVSVQPVEHSFPGTCMVIGECYVAPIISSVAIGISEPKGLLIMERRQGGNAQCSPGREAHPAAIIGCS